MQVYLGSIVAFGFGFTPQGWAQCNGQTLSISQNQALFALIGTFYGGNGTTNFNLPNLQSRVALGQGNGVGLGTYVIGEVSGSPNASILIANLPAHTHVATVAPQSIQAGSVAATTTSPAGNNHAGAYQGAPARSGGLFVASGSAGPLAALASNTVTGGAVTNALTGSNTPINVQSPYLAINFCIALTGIFPTRD
jgi:microcystin-dependent protein